MSGDVIELRLSNYRCICDLTDEALHDWFAEPVVFKNRVDWHMRPRAQDRNFVEPHGYCINGDYTDTTHLTDLSLFAVSRNIKHDALRIFYSTSTFSFSSITTLEKWLGISASPFTSWSQSLRPPSDLKDCIQKLRLESKPLAHRMLRPLEIEFDARYLAQAFRILSMQLPNLTSLHLSLSIDGYATCFRQSHGTTFVRLFQPLRRLKKLKWFTLVILEDNATCGLAIHDKETHERGSRDTFFERKKIRQMWAEEIANLVVGEKN